PGQMAQSLKRDVSGRSYGARRAEGAAKQRREAEKGKGPAGAGKGEQALHVSGFDRGADPYHRGGDDRDIETLRADRGSKQASGPDGASRQASGRAERRTRHHGQDHRADRAAGPGMDAGARGNEVEGGKARQNIAGRNEPIGEMQNQHEAIRRGAIADPARKPDEMKPSRQHQQYAARR